MNDLVKFVTQFVCDWKKFARCMNFLESEIRLAEAIPIEKLSETKERYPSIKYALYFIRRFLDQKQDVTSWAFWCNLLSKFDDGKFCIEKIKSSGKLILIEEDLSKSHLKLISEKVTDWRKFARTMELSMDEIKNVEEDFETVKDRNEHLMKNFLLLKKQDISTWRFWKQHLQIFKEGEICIEEIETENVVFTSDESPCMDHIGLIKFISSHLNNWKELATLMNFDTSEIEQVEKTFKNVEEKCLHLMKKFLNGEQDITAWKFWRNLLNNYEEGKLIIYEVEKSKIPFFRQGSQDADHLYLQDNCAVISHQYDCFHSMPLLEMDVNKEINVNRGAGKVEIVSLETYKTWLETKKDYYDRYSYFRELNTFDFTGSLSNCEILQNFQDLLIDCNNNSFAVRGYSLKNHYALFGKTVVKKEHINNTFFVYLENENIFLNINICEKDENISDSIHKSLESYRYFQAVHEDIQNCYSIFIGVVAFDDAIENFKEFCPTCFEKYLLISKNVLTDKNTLRNWINDIKRSDTVTDIRNQLKEKGNKIENVNIGSTVKIDIVTFKALQQDDFPTFTDVSSEQTNELKKLLFLTPVQVAISITNNKHIVITGGYGSGKSLALMKRFERVISQLEGYSSIVKNKLCLICHDRQSKFLNQMELYKKEYTDITIVCTYPRVAVHKMKLSEIISEYTSQVNDNTNVHFFIDEFDGSCFDEAEVTKIASMKKQLKDSHIVVATQSLENQVASKDVGFKYKDLAEKANFSWFQLDSSMRCSVQVNNFIKETTSYLESINTERAVKNNYNSTESPVDIEYALENASQSYFSKEVGEFLYKFNQPDKIGHNVSCDNVKLYTIDTSKMHQVNSIYLILDQIFLTEEENKFVICFCNDTLYNSMFDVMQHFDEEWTGDIQEFLQMNTKKILITDYASVRGYEFENFVFVLNMNQKYMKFRYVECFSRATTSLFVIADTAGLTEDCNESKLLAVWKNSDNVSHFKMDYKAETDEFILSSQSESKTIKLKKNLKLLHRNLIESNHDSGNASISSFACTNIHSDEISNQLAVVHKLMIADNVVEFFKTMGKYHMDLLTLLEEDEGLIDTSTILKGMDPVNIVQCFWNENASIFDIDTEVVFFGSFVNLAMCMNSIETTKYVLGRGVNIDITESDTESNIKLPLYSEILELLGKYGLTKKSIFGKRWLGVAFFFDDIDLFEHILHVNNLNAKIHKICDWYPLLRLALYHKAMKIGELLINKYEVDINEQEFRYQKTVLHQAAITNKMEFAELVLAHGADISMTNKQGKTPYDCATSQKMKNLIDSYQPNIDVFVEPKSKKMKI